MIKHVKLFQAALLGAVTLAGCNAPLPTTDAPGAVDPAVNLTSAKYDLLAAPAVSAGVNASVDLPAADLAAQANANVAIASVSASSTLNSFFRSDYLLDGNIHSAWSPAADDAAPCLTFNLSERANLSAFAIKMSHADVTVDVAVCDNGVWSTIASDLSPTRTVMDTLKVKTSRCRQVKLTFRGKDVHNLKVCEVAMYGNGSKTPMPVPSPKPLPSVMPSVVPSVMPSPLPSLVPPVVPSALPSVVPPVVAHCGEVDGGGWLAVHNGLGSDKITLGFVAVADVASARGLLVVDDHVAHLRFHGRVNALECAGARAHFSGELAEGGHFDAVVFEDVAGRHVEFSADGGYHFSKLLFGGGLKFHLADCQTINLAEEAALCLDVKALGLGCSVDEHEHFAIDLDAYDRACDRGDFDPVIAPLPKPEGDHQDGEHRDGEHNDNHNVEQHGEH